MFHRLSGPGEQHQPGLTVVEGVGELEYLARRDHGGYDRLHRIRRDVESIAFDDDDYSDGDDDDGDGHANQCARRSLLGDVITPARANDRFDRPRSRADADHRGLDLRRLLVAAAATATATASSIQSSNRRTTL